MHFKFIYRLRIYSYKHRRTSFNKLSTDIVCLILIIKKQKNKTRTKPCFAVFVKYNKSVLDFDCTTLGFSVAPTWPPH